MPSPRPTITGAYLALVLIWSTTALAIKWSVADLSPLAAMASRFSLGALLALGYAFWRGDGLPLRRQDLAAYALAGGSMLLSMACSYWSAQTLPSGTLAVVFGLAPLLTAALARLLLQEKTGLPALTGMVLGVLGLARIFASDSALGQANQLALLAALLAVLSQALGAVGMKKLAASTGSSAITAGSMLFAALALLPFWLGSEALPRQPPSSTTLGCIVYLAVVGSLLGMNLYFFLLRRLSPARLALITLITPLLALLLGQWLNGEAADPRVWQGALLILAGLGLNQSQALRQWWRAGR